MPAGDSCPAPLLRLLPYSGCSPRPNCRSPAGRLATGRDRSLASDRAPDDGSGALSDRPRVGLRLLQQIAIGKASSSLSACLAGVAAELAASLARVTEAPSLPFGRHDRPLVPPA